MKKLILLLIASFSIQIGYCQEKIKFGTVSLEQLQMDKYTEDTLASAVILHESSINYFIYDRTGFKLVSEYIVRIKILTTEGVDMANHSFLLYKGRSRDDSDNHSGLTGYTHNLENGKIVKENLAKKYIFTEEINENTQRVKFAMPAVKPGSVIEYKYTITSPRYAASRTYYFQRNIPVDYSYFSIKIPEYFRFDREVTGYERINVSVKDENQTFLLGQGKTHQCTAELITVEARWLPALKDDGYIFHYQDFSTGIKFELRSVAFPGSYYKDYSTTWNGVAKQLIESNSFGGRLKYKNLFISFILRNR